MVIVGSIMRCENSATIGGSTGTSTVLCAGTTVTVGLPSGLERVARQRADRAARVAADEVRPTG